MKGVNPIYTAEVQKLLHKKYIETIRIYDLTVQISDSLNHNDMVSTQMFLNMRQDAIVAAATVDEEIAIFISTLPEEEQGRMQQLISKSWKDVDIKHAGETQVGEEWERVYRQMTKTIQIDKMFATKLGGKNSYYAQKEKGLL